MTELTLDEAFQQALTHHLTGQLQEAETLYRAILQVQPKHPDANRNLGLLLSQQLAERRQEAESLYQTILQTQPEPPEPEDYADLMAPAAAPSAPSLSTTPACPPPSPPASQPVQPPQAPMPETTGRRKQKHRKTGQKTRRTATPAERQALITLFEAGRLTEGDAAARQFTRRYPHDGFGWKVHGTILAQLGQDEAALPALQRALDLTPRDPDIHNSLGVVFGNLERLDDALASYRQTLALNPQSAEAHNNLGTAFKDLGRLSEAEASYRQALTLQPGYAEAHSNLGNVLRDQGRLDEAEARYRQALALQPDFARAHSNLGAMLLEIGRLSEAEAHCRQALALQPNSVRAHSHLGTALKELGQLDEALDCYAQALAIKPDDAQVISNRLFTLNYHPDKAAAEIFAAYQEFDRQFGLPHRAAWRPHANDRDPRRRLRIGYVSPDFRRHSVRHFLEPLLANHDRRVVEITAYAELVRADDFTKRYQGHVDHWVPTVGLTDAALAERIRADGIDILVDLAGHTAGNRLGVFARKPAPVSMSWLGYGYTTGLSAIDYFLTDAIMVPPGSERLFAETPWRLPARTGLYRPAEGMGEVSPPPVCANGFITFGTLSRAVRINHRTIQVWSAILQRLPGAQLIIDSLNFGDAHAQDQLAARFAEHGVGRERLHIGYHSPPWDRLRAMDIGLDCFPHNSGTTLVEHLYLGMPFVTLAGRPSVGRLGAFVLHGVGHPEWIAESEEEYIEIAVALAKNSALLADLRARLRSELRASPLMDSVGFVRTLEQAYREMWVRWCESGAALHEGTNPDLDLLFSHPPAGRQEDADCLHLDAGRGIHPVQHVYPPPTVATAPARKRSERGEYPVRPENGEASQSTETNRHPTAALTGSSQSSGTATSAERQALLALFEAGRFNDCEAAAQEFTQRYPNDGFGWKVYGSVMALLKRGETAIPVLLKALTMHPHDPEIHNTLGVILGHLGRPEDALAHYRQALELRPDYAEAHNNLGTSLTELDRLSEAETSYRRAIALQPSYVKAHSNLGNTLKNLGRLDEAEASHRRALALQPDYAEAHSNLGTVLKDLGRLAEAESSCRQALALQPDLAEAHNNLGTVYKELGRLEEAEASCRQALALRPELADTHSNLGNVLKDFGQFDEALDCYAQALAIKPDLGMAFHNRLFTLNYHPDKPATEIFAAYQEFDRQFGLPHRAAWRPHLNDRDPRRRLHIGYVSPDFRRHSTRHFLEPLLANHDKRIVEITAYAELAREDDFSALYKSYMDHWVPTRGMTDAALAERIRADGIDILVDLAGHTDSSRLLVFACKPAPVSMSWMGSGYTTGLSAIDYFLTDPIIVPPGSEGLFAEKPWRMTGPAGIYRPTKGMGEIGPLPANNNNFVTFGTLTRSVRINHRTIRVWSAILKRVPRARLMIDSINYKDSFARDKLAVRFAEHGIGPERLLMGYHSPPWDQMRAMDIGLDGFPHNSGTTLFEHLYMGIPFITLAGRPSVGRIGASILHWAGRPEWIAECEDDYVERTVALASDLVALAGVRPSLRSELQTGPWMNEPAFVRRLEQAYRDMWMHWCNKGADTLNEHALNHVNRGEKKLTGH